LGRPKLSEREGTMWTYDILSRIFLLTPAKTVGTGEGGGGGGEGEAGVGINWT